MKKYENYEKKHKSVIIYETHFHFPQVAIQHPSTEYFLS